MENCSILLKAALKRAQANLGHSFLHDEKIAARVLSVVNCPSNRAGVRLLLSCMLAKVHRPEIDPRKPYTKIGTKDCFSGRAYDERFIGEFITKNMTKRVESKSLFWIVLDFCGISCISFTVFAKIFSTNTKCSFFATRTAPSGRG